MQANYQPFIRRLIDRYEGGYGWNPKDTGGPTKYGITCYDLAEHRGQKMDSMSRWAPIVKAMEMSEAEAIYKKKYAAGIAFDQLPSGVDCALLDYAVNSGVGRATLVAKALTHSDLYSAALDKIKVTDAKTFIDQLCNERLDFMHRIRGGSAWQEFGRGWQARVDDLRQYSKALAGKTVSAPAPDLSNVPTPKVVHPKPDAVTVTVNGGSPTVGTSAVMWANGARLAAIVVLGAGVIGTVVYFVVQHRKAERENQMVWGEVPNVG